MLTPSQRAFDENQARRRDYSMCSADIQRLKPSSLSSCVTTLDADERRRRRLLRFVFELFVAAIRDAMRETAHREKAWRGAEQMAM